MTDILKTAREAIELAEKATPGPWLGIISNDRNGACFGCGPKHNLCYQDCYDTSDDCSDALSAHDDAALIAHAGTHYKELAQSVLDLSEQIRQLKTKYAEIDKAIEDMEVYGTGTIKMTHISSEEQFKDKNDERT